MPSLFKTAVKHSDVSGRGLFALEDIPVGSTWWVCDDSIKGVPTEGFSNLPCIIASKQNIHEIIKQTKPSELQDLLMYSMYYNDGDVLVMLRDGCGVVNHSEQPNSKVVFNPEGDWRQLKSVAIRDIKAGEEIVQNYGQYSKHNVSWLEEVYQRYLPERLEFEEKAKIEKIVE